MPLGAGREPARVRPAVAEAKLPQKKGTSRGLALESAPDRLPAGRASGRAPARRRILAAR